MRLDKLDWALLRELQSDARQTKRALAAKLGTSPNTIERRLKRLVDERAIRLTVGVDPSALGYTGSMIIGINVSGGDVRAVVDQLASVRGVFNVVVTIGRYDAIAWAGFRDSDHALQLISEGLGNIAGLSSVEIMTHAKLVKTSSDQLAVYDRRIVPELRNTDDKDLRLIEELVADPRASIRDLSAGLGLTSSTVQRRLQRLLDDRIIVPTAEPRRSALGFRTGITVLGKAHPRHVRAVAEKLAAYPQAATVGICVGAWDLIASYYFRDSNELAAFVGTELAAIPHLERHETLVGRRVVKIFGY